MPEVRVRGVGVDPRCWPGVEEGARPSGEGSAEQQTQEEPHKDGNLGGAKWRLVLFRTRDPWPYVVWGRWGHREGQMKWWEKRPEDTWPEEAWNSGAHEGLAWARIETQHTPFWEGVVALGGTS